MRSKLEKRYAELEKEYQSMIDKRNKVQTASFHIERSLIGLEKTIFEFNELLKENNKKEEGEKK